MFVSTSSQTSCLTLSCPAGEAVGRADQLSHAAEMAVLTPKLALDGTGAEGCGWQSGRGWVPGTEGSILELPVPSPLPVCP